LNIIIKNFIPCGGAEPQFRCAVRNQAPDGAEVRGAKPASRCGCPPLVIPYFKLIQ